MLHLGHGCAVSTSSAPTARHEQPSAGQGWLQRDPTCTKAQLPAGAELNKAVCRVPARSLWDSWRFELHWCPVGCMVWGHGGDGGMLAARNRK